MHCRKYVGNIVNNSATTMESRVEKQFNSLPRLHLPGGGEGATA